MVVDITGFEFDGLQVRTLAERRIGFSVSERHLQFPVNQQGLSNGTLRALALAVALAGVEKVGLFAVEEPENYLHPSAVEAFVRYLVELSESAAGTQVLVTTHSPLVLDYLGERPGCVAVVSGRAGEGTVIHREASSEAVAHALAESGFSLGEFWLSRGFRAE